MRSATAVQYSFAEVVCVTPIPVTTSEPVGLGTDDSGQLTEVRRMDRKNLAKIEYY